MSRVYLDHNATTPVEPEVLDAMLPYFSGDFGNAASIHTPGQRARAAVETAREQVAVLIGARPQEIVFTSGGTESDNHAIFGIARTASGTTKHLVTTQIEHPAVLDTCRYWENNECDVTYVQVDPTGRVDPTDIAMAIKPETALIAVMMANNEVGTIQPIGLRQKLTSCNRTIPKLRYPPFRSFPFELL